MVDIDSETLFNGAAAVVATIAVVVFTVNVDLGHSPLTKFALVVAFLSGVFAITQRTDDYQLTFLGYGVVVVSTLVVFFEVVNTFELGNAVAVLGLLVIAAVLFSVRSWLGEGDQFVAGRTATRAFAVVAVLVAGLLVVDVVTGGLVYELQPKSEVEFSEERHESVTVASLVVRNPTPLPERVERPNYRACAAGNWSAYSPESEPGDPPRDVHTDVHVRADYGEHVLGYTTKSYPVQLHLEGTSIRGETFPVKRTEDCPETETGDPYVAIFEAPRDRPYADAV